MTTADTPVPASRGLARRRIRPADTAFRVLALGSTLICLGVLGWLLVGILITGLPAIDFGFITDKGSTAAERAGFNSAIRGSLVLIMYTAAVALPLGVASALYLEKFAARETDLVRARLGLRLRELAERRAAGESSPGDALTAAQLRVRLAWARILPSVNRVIEVNIANLAAVPSIIYGLLGLAAFVTVIGMQKSLLAGGLTLGVLVAPIVIIASREALRAVPSSIEQGAMALGATRWQAVSRQVLPAALPGMLTGAILAMSRAIGETAPLVVVGGVVFGTAVPSVNPLSANGEALQAMPLQIFAWADDPRADFRELAAGGIIVLLGVLILVNLAAVLLRNRYRRRW